jgi:aconitase B
MQLITGKKTAEGKTEEVYRYMNFDQIPEFVRIAQSVDA